AKIEGRKIVPLRQPEPTKPNDLLEALRMSASNSNEQKSKPRAKKPSTGKKPASPEKKTATSRRKAS
ncbi:MAG TPA: Ku protein, partial [Devosia sp.]